MPVPTDIDDLSTTAASNSPGGGESPITADDYLRQWAAFIATLRDSVAPVGGIMMYSGLAADLPANWKICDGTAGTPDLRNRFIIGAGSTYAIAAVGGSADAVVVAHTHNGTTGNESATHSHAVTDGGHVHSMFGGSVGRVLLPGVGGGGNYGPGPASTGDFTNTASAVTGISLGNESANHNHAFTTGSSGVAATGANLPPYYALAYIRRMS